MINHDKIIETNTVLIFAGLLFKIQLTNYY